MMKRKSLIFAVFVFILFLSTNSLAQEVEENNLIFSSIDEFNRIVDYGFVA